MLDSNEKSITASTATPSPWYTCAVYSAYVAGAFSVIVALLLLVNAYHLKITDINNEEQLVAMKEQLRKAADDEKLFDQIRQQDQQNRQDRFRRLDFARLGSYLLLGGLAVFFVALKFAAVMSRKLPHPQPQPDKQQLQTRSLVLARRAVVACVIAFCLVSVVIAFKGEINFSGKDKPVAPYPTMEEVNRNWASFRGPEGAGISPYTNIPDAWDGKSGQNIRWKTPVPLEGFNSPVVWGNRIFLTSADNKEFIYQVHCFDADSGKLLWTSDVPDALNADGEHVEVMEDTGFAAPTTATDGRRVYAMFATGNVAAFDYDGNRVWVRKLGIPDSVYGYASSLAMYQDKVIVQFDQATADDGLSKVVALDSMTGKTVYETKRPVGNSWSSPIVAKTRDGYRLITTADPYAIVYDLAHGKELWRSECIMGDIAPSPIYSNGLIFAIEPYSRLVALRTGGTGNVTETHTAWFAEDDIPDICSPVSTGELIYILTTDGFLTCYNQTDGKKLYDHEIEKSNFHASPSLVGDKLYLLTLKGVMHIIAAGGEYKEITTCDIGEKCYASPAFADGRIYIRARHNLYCIEAASGKEAPAAAAFPTMEEVYLNWPAFRGPDGSGTVPFTNIPDKWDGKTGENIVWKTPVPLKGHSSPVVWGDRVFLTGADDKEYVYHVYGYDANTGKLLWTGNVPNALNADGEPLEVMEDTGLAAPTAVTDGRRVYAMFATGNVAAFDYEGNQVWLRKLGVPDSVYGYASSLAMYQDKVIVQFDEATSDDGLSRLIALDSLTGKTVYETKRPVGNSWSSPIVAKNRDGYRLITTADPFAIVYDPADGKELWRSECIMGDIAPSPIYSNGLLFAIEPYSRLVALRTRGEGNVTETHVAWFAEDDIPDICSPVSTGEIVYILTTDGFLTCYNQADGKKLYDHEIEKSNFNASPSLVGDKLYLLTIKGVMRIIAAGSEYEEITTCDLGEKCYASPAFTNGRIYIRAADNLYCIGKKD